MRLKPTSNFLKRGFAKICRDFITLITKRKRNRIVFIQESSSGSNSYALFIFANEEIKYKYELILLNRNDSTGLSHFIRMYRLLSSAQLIVTTHASFKPGKKYLHLQLWHGFPLKKLGLMEQEKSQKFKHLKEWEKVDFVMSYSETYNTFLNACMLTDPRKYVITGAPRNDFLFKSDGHLKSNSLFSDVSDDYKLMIFMPTFREGYNKKQGDKEYNNPFGFKEFLTENFDNFLEKNKYKLILKLHPDEETLILKYFLNYPVKNILILQDKDLTSNGFDLYEILNSFELLITDYSSVFVDFLLLDKPIIFAPVDLDAYKKTRGLVVESYDSWTPGPKVYDQEALQNEICNCMSNPDYYREQRTLLRDIQHRYTDGESSSRLWNFIDSHMPRNIQNPRFDNDR